MNEKTNNEETQIAKLINRRARNFVKQNPGALMDEYDVSSKIMERFVKKSRYFNEEKATREQFVNMIASNVIAELGPKAEKEAAVRDLENSASFEDVVETDYDEDNGGEESFTVSERIAAKLGGFNPLKFDINEALRLLPRKDRELARLIMQGYSYREIAKHFGVSLDVVIGSKMTSLKKNFTKVFCD